MEDSLLKLDFVARLVLFDGRQGNFHSILKDFKNDNYWIFIHIDGDPKPTAFRPHDVCL